MLKQTTAALLLLVPVMLAQTASATPAQGKQDVQNKASATSKKVSWQHDLKSGFNLAKQQGKKYVFVDVGAPW